MERRSKDHPRARARRRLANDANSAVSPAHPPQQPPLPLLEVFVGRHLNPQPRNPSNVKGHELDEIWRKGRELSDAITRRVFRYFTDYWGLWRSMREWRACDDAGRNPRFLRKRRRVGDAHFRTSDARCSRPRRVPGKKRRPGAAAGYTELSPKASRQYLPNSLKHTHIGMSVMLSVCG